MAAKKTTAKKKGTKKTAPKKEAVKDTKSKPVPSNNKKGKESVKESTESKKEEAAKSAHVSEEMEEVSEEKKSNVWMVATIILAIIVAILALVVGYKVFGPSGDVAADCGLPGENGTVVDANVDGTDSMNTEMGTVKLLVLEDPSCASCQVDLFVSQIEQNLFNDLEVEKIDFQTERGAALLAELEVTQLPVYLFDDEVVKSDEWEQGLSDVFDVKDVEDATYYMVMPQYVQNKVMIEAPEITETAIVVGEEDAPVTVIQFTDYECPFCAIADGNEEMVEQFRGQYPDYEAPMPLIYQNYVDEGLVKVVFYNFPIPSLHPQAEGAHLAALCANEQDMWEEYSANLWESRSEWIEASDREEVYKQYAADLGLDEDAFATCLDEEKYADQIAEEQALGQKYGVSGTPAFFVGRSFISGAQPYEAFEVLIEEQLAALE